MSQIWALNSDLSSNGGWRKRISGNVKFAAKQQTLSNRIGHPLIQLWTFYRISYIMAIVNIHFRKSVVNRHPHICVVLSTQGQRTKDYILMLNAWLKGSARRFKYTLSYVSGDMQSRRHRHYNLRVLQSIGHRLRLETQFILFVRFCFMMDTLISVVVRTCWFMHPLTTQIRISTFCQAGSIHGHKVRYVQFYILEDWQSAWKRWFLSFSRVQKSTSTITEAGFVCTALRRQFGHSSGQLCSSNHICILIDHLIRSYLKPPQLLLSNAIYVLPNLCTLHLILIHNWHMVLFSSIKDVPGKKMSG